MTCRFADENAATNWALDWLRQRGYAVTLPPRAEMMAPAKVRKRYAPHLSPGAFWKRIAHRDCPDFLRVDGPSGRLVELVPNAALLAWLAKPMQPGAKLESGATV